jgi:hydroxymethylglutaryl-CoA lyase
MGFTTGIDLPKLIEARAILREGLPNETMRGGVPQAGIPKTFSLAA